jgi:tetratricopeptide (TPR) repeat protein
VTKARASEAFDLLKAGREKEARTILETIVRDDMADAAVLETLGDVREKLGDRQGALDAYAGAVTHLRARGEGRRALGVLELMILVDEKNLWARGEGAEIRWELGDDAGCWREVVGACELLVARGETSGAAFFAKKYADALPDAGPALQVSRSFTGPAAAALCVELGNALRRRDKHDDALALYVRALELAPQLREAHHARAGALLATGRTAEARVVVDQILALDPRDLVALSLLERIAAILGDDATVRFARDRFDRIAGDRDDPHEHPEAWSEDTAELRRSDTEDDPTDLEG